MSPNQTNCPPGPTMVCTLGQAEAAWLDQLQASLPAHASMRELAEHTPAAALHELAGMASNVELILVQHDSLLPEHWYPRIHAALDMPDVLAVQALSPDHLPGLAAVGDLATLQRLDALCYVHGERQALRNGCLDAPLVALRGAAIECLPEFDGMLYMQDVPASCQVMCMEDLLVAGPDDNGQRIAIQRTQHLALAETLLAGMAADTVDSGYPGLDGKPVLLHVLHGWGGGAARWVGDLAAGDDRHHHLLLQSHGSFKNRCHGESLTLHDARAADLTWRRFRPAQAIASSVPAHADYREFLHSLLRDYAVDAVLVSSLIGHSLDALRTGLPTTLMVHDHYPLWPLLHCDFGADATAFETARLQADLAAAGADFEFAERHPRHWQQLRETYVENARNAQANLLAPSHSALQAHLRLAPALQELSRAVIPHALAAWPMDISLREPPARQRLRLLVPGRVRKGKGGDLLHAILPRLHEHAELVLLGAGAEGMEFFGQANVHVVLDYTRNDLPQLIADLAPDAALLLPTVSETFSYTLSEMRSLGVPVIATRIGALAERIEDGVDGLLVEAKAEAIIKRIGSLAEQPDVLMQIRRHLAEAAKPDTLSSMADAHAHILALAVPAARYIPGKAGVAELNARQNDHDRRVLQHALHKRELTLQALQAEIDRRGEWAWKLDREQRQTATRLTQTQDELEQRSVWALSLDKQLQSLNKEMQLLKPAYEQMLSSRSWRLTRPLRAATTHLRGLRAGLGFRWARLRSLHGRLRGSLSRRGVAGTLKRIRQEFDQRQLLTVAFQHPQPGDAFVPFAMPSSEAPEVSIIIPIHNQFEYTAACLRSLAEHAATTPFEVIVVDDASTDASAERLAQIDAVRVLHNPENLGFIGSCNVGAAAAKGEYVLLLNNDTLVTTGWLEAMLACFAAREDAGLVGARLIYPDGRLQESGGIVFSDGSGWNYGRFEHADEPRCNFRRQVDYCSGAAIMLKRALFEQLGGLDQRYSPAYYEDTDLAFAVRKAGHAVYVEPRTLVVHFEGISNGTDTGTGIKRYQALNHDIFVDKWKDQLQQQPAPIDAPGKTHLAATWRARKRVLIVDASTPTPDQDSGSLRLLNIMRLLRDMGCQVSFLPDNLARFEKYTPLLQDEGIEALYQPFVADLPSFYHQRGSEFDLIMISRHYVAAHHLGLARVHAPQARLVFDTVDLHYLRERRAAELDPHPELYRQAESTRRQELKLINECDVTLVVSKVEQKLLAEDAPAARVEILSNVHAVHGCRAGFDQRSGLLFIGGFQHPPNIDAMLWFTSEVLPHVHARLPGLRLDIVGSKLTAQIEALASDSVIVHGFVEDIEPMLDSARISVAPLRYGAGVKGKVNMAMSYGLPVIATPMAVEGIDAEPGRDVLVGADASAFAEAIICLYQDPELWATLSRNGLDNVRRQFSFDTARAALEHLLA